MAFAEVSLQARDAAALLECGIVLNAGQQRLLCRGGETWS